MALLTASFPRIARRLALLACCVLAPATAAQTALPEAAATVPAVPAALAGDEPVDKQSLAQGILAGIGVASLLLVPVAMLAWSRGRRATRALRAVQQDLIEQRNFQSTLFDTIPYPVFVKDAQNRYLAVNPAYEKRFEVRAAQLIGRTRREAGHLTRVTVDNQIMDVPPPMGTTETHTVVTRLPDGRERHEVLWVKSLPLRDQEPVGYIGAGMDITEIKLAEARAKASEQRLREITETLPAAVFQLRIQADGRRRFTYAAGNTLGTIGMTPEALVADEAKAWARIHPADQPLVEQHVSAAVTSMHPIAPFQARMHTDIGLRWISSAGGQPRVNDDGSIEWSGYWIDVTDSHEQAQALTEAKIQAEAAVAAQSAFLAMMSHEIRTPMAGVLSLVELLAQTRMDDDQTHMITLVQESAGALLHVLDDILDFSRIQSGRLGLEARQFDPRAMIDGVIGLFSGHVQEKPVRLYSIVDPRLAAKAVGDDVRLRQILTNLLSNALKFTEQGHVELRVTLLGESAGEQRIGFSVSDSGIGIAAEKIEHLFQPFSQADHSTARKFGGTGLGLTISRQLARMMGGDIQLHSAPQAGTRVTLEVTLPVAEAPVAETVFAGKRTLVCIADRKSSEQVGNALRWLGFAVLDGEPGPPDRIDLQVVDHRPGGARVPGAAPYLRYSDSPDPRGFHIGPKEMVLHGNPLLLRSVRDACCAALGQTAQASPGEPPVHASNQAHARILVAEDHPVNRVVIARQLAHLGYIFTLVGDGEEALQAVRSSPYDLLLSDCNMPRMDGYTLTRHIREDEAAHPGKRLPIIALSASALKEQAQRCLEAGMDDFLAKPVQIQTLQAMLALHLGRRVAEAPVKTIAPSASDPVAHLIGLFGDAGKTRAIIEQLLATSAKDMAALDEALLSADAPRQQALLHRIKGALVLFLTAEQAAGLLDTSRPAVEQRELVSHHLQLLQTALQQMA